MVFLIFNFLYRFAPLREQKRMKKISLCCHGTVGNFSSLAKKRLHRLREKKHIQRSAKIWSRPLHMKELQNQGLHQVEGWWPKRDDTSTWSDVSTEKHNQESLLKHKESRTNPQDSMPPQSKAKVETKSFQKLKDSEDEIFLEAQGENPERWKATRKRKPCCGRESATTLRSYLLRNDVSPFSIFSSLALQTHISMGMPYYVLGFWKATCRFWRGGCKNTHFIWIPNFWNQCTYLCYDKTLVRKRCCDSLKRKVRMA